MDPKASRGRDKRGCKWGKHARLANLLADVEAALAEIQPHLRIVKRNPELVIEGSFLLCSSDGSFDQYQIRIHLTDGFPWREPKLYETDGRIPRTQDRHINNKEGECCPTVWEHWLVTAIPHTSFKDFLNGPVHEFFLNQWWFEKKGYWRFGERSHRASGLVEAYAEVLGVPAQQGTVFNYLKELAKTQPKGHQPCPCGSGLKLRQCHRKQLHELHQRVPSKMAKRMLLRLRESLEKQGASRRRL